MKMLLQEFIAPNQAKITHMKKQNGELFLSGIMMQAGLINGNGREYPLNEISKAVEECSSRISRGNYIMGELNHPDSLQINLANVSHAITEIKMLGNNAVGKMKVLNTPTGNIAKAIMEGGVKLGVSSRGSGEVDMYNKVKDFMIVTVDIVANPSAPDAFPDIIYEARNIAAINRLAEDVCHDAFAQKYLQREISKLIREITTKG